MELTDDDKVRMAFATPFGLYQFQTIPFRLCNVSAMFQCLMETRQSSRRKVRSTKYQLLEIESSG
ncbi:hypothetical protein T10_171 [Trichinella papuae]|uniref:Uncharacterized protein n=1 Tax=Trichinella papuae TaxID=268474 RepID=A0A0V1MJP1_9BILA|nr:hypothetical protein T10_171 [Trichinella papuae]